MTHQRARPIRSPSRNHATAESEWLAAYRQPRPQKRCPDWPLRSPQHIFNLSVNCCQVKNPDLLGRLWSEWLSNPDRREGGSAFRARDVTDVRSHGATWCVRFVVILKRVPIVAPPPLVQRELPSRSSDSLMIRVGRAFTLRGNAPNRFPLSIRASVSAAAQPRMHDSRQWKSFHLNRMVRLDTVAG